MRRRVLEMERVRRFVTVRALGWEATLILSLFWLRRGQLWMYWDAGMPILRLGPLVVRRWRR